MTPSALLLPSSYLHPAGKPQPHACQWQRSSVRAFAHVSVTTHEKHYGSGLYHVGVYCEEEAEFSLGCFAKKPARAAAVRRGTPSGTPRGHAGTQEAAAGALRDHAASSADSRVVIAQAPAGAYATERDTQRRTAAAVPAAHLCATLAVEEVRDLRPAAHPGYIRLQPPSHTATGARPPLRRARAQPLRARAVG